MYKEFGIKDEVLNLSKKIANEIAPVFKEIEENWTKYP